MQKHPVFLFFYTRFFLSFYRDFKPENRSNTGFTMEIGTEKCYNGRMKGGHDFDEISEPGFP